MGLDLTVMASHFRKRRGELLPTATLRFDRDAAIFSQLAPKPPRASPTRSPMG